MNRTLVLVALLLSGVASIAWSQGTSPGAAPYVPDPANFTGKVTTSPSNDVRVTRLTFEPRARTNWHSHAGGQVILVEKGRRWSFRSAAQSQTRQVAKSGLGTHTGSSQTSFTGMGRSRAHHSTQVAFSFGTTNWLQRVTERAVRGRCKK